MMNSLDKLMSSGAKSAFPKGTPIGKIVSGTIINAIERQKTDYLKKEPSFWNDGTPVMQIVVSIKTDLREDAEDDGSRSIYIKSWGEDKLEFLNAIRAAGFTKASEALSPGNLFSVAFVGTEPSNNGNDRNVYKYRIQRGTQIPSMDADPFGAPQPPAGQPTYQAPGGGIPSDPWAAASAPQPTPPPAPVVAGNPWATPPAQPTNQPAQYAAPQPVQQATPVQTPVGPVNPQTGEILPAAPQPPAQPAPAAPVQPTPQDLIRAGWDDAQIATQLNLDPTVVATIRTQI